MAINKSINSSENDSEKVRSARLWFSLSNYKAAEKFSRIEWGQQIYKRCLIDDALNSLDSEPDRLSYLEEHVPALLKNPLAPFDMTFKSFGLAAGATNPVLRHLTFADLQRFAGYSSDMPPRHNREPIDEWAQRVDWLSGSKPRHLVVDLTASNKQLEASFQEWLGLQRQSLPDLDFKAKDDVKRFNAWSNGNYLPYYDLTLWGRFNKNLLTEIELVRLMFPLETANKVDVFLDTHRSRLRKFKENASEIISFENVHQLLTA